MVNSFVDIFWNGRSMSYTEGFAVALVKLLALIGGLCWFVASVIQISMYCWQRRKSKKEGEEVKTSKGIIIAEVIADIFFWGGACFIALIFTALSAFGLLYTSGAIILMVIFFTLCLAYQVFRISLYDKGSDTRFNKWITSVKRIKWVLLILFVIFVFISVFIPIILCKSCLSHYNSGYALTVIMDMDYSTQFTRKYWLPDQVCRSEELCHVYATLPSNTSGAVFMNAHAGSHVDRLHLKIFTEDQDDSHIINCQQIHFPEDVEDIGQRNIFTCLSRELFADTTYTVQIYTNGELDQPVYNSTYKTLPNKNSMHELRVLFGGDYGFLTEGRELVDNISNLKPDLILIGGDIAYDNGNIHCYYSWDLMLWDFEKEFDQMGRIIPFIFAVGNHDVGFNAMADVNITVTNDGPLYFTYFPQRFDDEEKQFGIPDIEHRITFHQHFVGNLLFISLDSGYLYKSGEKQLEWLENVLQRYGDDYHVFMQYHNPIYPVCFKNVSLMQTSIDQMEASARTWIPLFDKYNVVAAFENHGHQFKRTYPLRNNSVAPDGKGTVYFGDGAMGVAVHQCDTKAQTSLAKFKNFFAASQIEDSQHYWIMDIKDDGQVEYTAYTPKKKILDKTVIQLKKEDL